MAAACTKNAAPAPFIDQEDTPSQEMVTIEAGIQPVGQADSRNTLADADGQRTIKWEDADVIGITDKNGSTIVAASVDAEQSIGTSATFIYDSKAVRDGIAAAFYPYSADATLSGSVVSLSLPSEQPYRAGSCFGQDVAIMAGSYNGTALTFTCACSIFKVSLTGEGILQSLSLTSPEPIAGKGVLDLDAASPAFRVGPDGVGEISLLLPEEGVRLSATPTDFYFVLPAGTHESLTINAATDGICSCISNTIAHKLTVNHMLPINPIAISKPSAATDLTEGRKWANSFLVENPGSGMYSFAVNRVDGTAPAGNLKGCGILWQEVDRMVDCLTLDCNEGVMYFRLRSGQSGNSVVRVYDNSGKTLWSYHIWVPGTQVGTRRFGSYTVMDRNLGAITADATDKSSLSAGLHYQWGRKDPFPPVDELITTGNRDHREIFPDPINFIEAQTGVTVETAIEHPENYYWGTANSGAEDWTSPQVDTLWGAGLAKTNFDPCPYGWTVAPADAYEAVLDNLKEGTFATSVGLQFKDSDGTETLLPASGYYRRMYNASSQMCNVGTFSWIWTKNADAYNTSYRGSVRLQSAHSSAAALGVVPRRWGANVRCVKMQ